MPLCGAIIEQNMKLPLTSIEHYDIKCYIFQMQWCTTTNICMYHRDHDLKVLKTFGDSATCGQKKDFLSLIAEYCFATIKISERFLCVCYPVDNLDCLFSSDCWLYYIYLFGLFHRNVVTNDRVAIFQKEACVHLKSNR